MQTAACFDHLQVLVLQASGISKVPIARSTGGSGNEPWNDCKECAVFFSAQGAFRRARCLAGSPVRSAKRELPALGGSFDSLALGNREGEGEQKVQMPVVW